MTLISLNENRLKMFFYLSKIIWTLIDPANLLTILFAAGLLAFAFKRLLAAKIMLGCSFALLLIFGVFPIGHSGLYFIETRYAVPNPMPKDIDGIVVLGGAIESQKSERSGRPEFNEGAERVLSAMALARDYPNAKIIFSGGSSRLAGSKRSEAVDLDIFLRGMSFDMRNVIFEDQSRNTYENILRSKALAGKAIKGDWVLITSAFHTPRSMAIAAKQGWAFIPYPVDYRSQGRYLLLPRRFDILDNLYASKLFLRELTGIVAYKITGKL
jgi:uncharacterized SAM-binding protein YcdF (DUF218 family)